MPNQDSELFTRWKIQVEDWKKSNCSMAKWCRERSLPYHQFLYWKERILQPTPVKFVELQDAQSTDSGISIMIKSVVVHVEKNFDENTFLRILYTLEKRIC